MQAEQNLLFPCGSGKMLAQSRGSFLCQVSSAAPVSVHKPMACPDNEE